MAYARFGKNDNDYPDSDIYVWSDGEDFRCTNCSLENGFGEYKTDSAEQMLEHMKLHKAIGEAVPHYATERLQTEIDKGIWD